MAILSYPILGSYAGSAFTAQTVDTSSNATVYSAAFEEVNTSIFSLHFEWSGTPTSTITLWSTNKRDPLVSGDTDWVQETGVTFTNPAGSASKAMVHIGNSGARRYRIKVVTASGSGTISCWVNGR